MSAAALIVVFALAAPISVGGEAGYTVVKVVHYGKHHHKTKRACKRHGDRHCRKHVHRRRVLRPAVLAPVPPPAPVAASPPSPTPVPTPEPTPPPLPSRTSVDLTEWQVTPSYLELRAGEIEFNAANLGEDDHDFSVRDAVPLVTVPLAPGQSEPVRLTLGAGVYTLYCSLPDHEELGMRAEVTVR